MNKNYNRLKIFIGIFSVFFSFMMLFSSGVNKKIVGQAKFELKQDDLFSKESLKTLIKNKKSTTIVVRNLAINYTGLSVSGGDPTNTLINILEKVFTKNDFIVRDRALFEKSFSQNSAVDYSKMKELTNTDLIIELVQISNIPFVTNSYYNKGHLKKIPNIHAPLNYSGIKIELKIVNVKENEIVGTYTFYDTPCIEGCNVYKYMKSYYSYDPTRGLSSYSLSYDGSSWENFTKGVAEKLISSFNK